jgi:hypothetical protein
VIAEMNDDPHGDDLLLVNAIFWIVVLAWFGFAVFMLVDSQLPARAIASESVLRQREVVAQEGSASWAFWMVCISALGVVVTLLGTIMLYRQIRLTRDALTETRKATVAVNRANELTEVYQKRALRAYLTMGDVKLDRTIAKGVAPSLKHRLINTGQTPALRVKVDREFVVAPIDAKGFDFEPDDSGKTLFLGGNSDVWGDTRGSAIGSPDYENLVAGTHHLYFVVKIEYFDVFRDRHETRMTGVCVDALNEKDFIKAPFGNTTSDDPLET